MTSSNPQPTIGSKITRNQISNDIFLLLSLPVGQSLDLLSPKQIKSASPSTASASHLLSTFSPSVSPGDFAAIEKSVALSAAYTKDMRALQQQGLEGQLENAGQGIEGVRERAEGVQAALGEVKI